MNEMPQVIKGVDVTLKANVYFNGGVVSHTITSPGGAKRTVGIIRPGKYHFNTDVPERMDIVGGTCAVKLTGEEDWKNYAGGQTFRIPGKSGFDIEVKDGLTEYLCTFE